MRADAQVKMSGCMGERISMKAEITSTANKQIKNVVLLQKKAKERKRQGCFVAEGQKLLRETPAELLREVYISESFPIQRDALPGELLEDWRQKGGCVITVSEAVFSHMSDTQTPQGILAVVKMPEYTLDEILRKRPAHLLLTEGIQDPGNLGTMFRTGEGAGVTGILMSRETVDLFHPKTVRSTMGSIYRVPFLVVENWAETLETLREQGICLYAAHLRGQKDYDQFDFTRDTGFLIGNEGNGLTEATASLADEYLRIPMEGRLESLNAAMAAGILMYETYRQRREH